MINLLYCSNANGFDGILINLLSLIKYTSRAVHVYILTMDLRNIDEKHVPISEEERSYLESIIKKKNTDSSITLLDCTDVFIKEVANGNPNMDSFYTPYCMLRLVADLIPELPGKIIYMDTDTAFFDDAGQLFDIDITDYELGAVEDFLGRWFKYIGYINSGILLLNLKKIRETGLFAKTRQGCKSRKSWFPDQDALNNNIEMKLMLPEKFNSQRRLKKDTVVLHFCKSIRWLPFYHTVNVKPWQVDKVHSVLKITALDDVLNDYLVRKDVRNG